MHFEIVPVDQIHANENNPRAIKGKDFLKLKKSISDFPEMLKIRAVVVDENNTVIGGNMRFEAVKALGWKDIPVIFAKDLSESQKREFIIKDNTTAGDWDLNALTSWDPIDLSEWGLEFFAPESFEIKNVEIKPYKKVHVLISFAPEVLHEIEASLEQIKNTKGVVYEQSAN